MKLTIPHDVIDEHAPDDFDSEDALDQIVGEMQDDLYTIEAALDQLSKLHEEFHNGKVKVRELREWMEETYG